MRRITFRCQTVFGVAALAAATLSCPFAVAQHGLLHKHRAVGGPAMPGMRPLATQTMTVAATPNGVTSSDGPTSTMVTAIVGTGATAGAVGCMPPTCSPPIAALPNPGMPVEGLTVDALPMPLPVIVGGLPTELPVDPSVGIGPPPGGPGFVGGWGTDFGPSAIGLGNSDRQGPLPTGGHPHGGPPMFGRPIALFNSKATAALSASAPAQRATPGPISAPPGHSVTAGMPGRAVGARPGQFNAPGRHAMAPIDASRASTTPSATGSGQEPGVVRAKHEAASRALGGAAAPAAGATGGAANTPPRWRDRIRIAWPTSN